MASHKIDLEEVCPTAGNNISIESHDEALQLAFSMINQASLYLAYAQMLLPVA